MTDLLGGQVQMQFSGLPPLLPVIRAGRLRALAVGGTQRSTALPDTPTIAESGLPGYEAASWQGVAVPAATPEAIVGTIHREIARFVATPDAKVRFAEIGAEPVGGTPDAFAAFIRSEVAKWAQVIRRSGARAD
jgi:tripartite-type tricarboxylate transporter receptor subunit TctC